MSSLKNEGLVSVHIMVAALKAFGELNQRIKREERSLNRRSITLTKRMLLQYRELQEQVRLYGLIVNELWRWKDGAARWLKQHQEDPKPFLRWVDKLWVARDFNGNWRSLIRPKRLYPIIELFRAANIVAIGSGQKGSDPTSLTDTDSARPKWNRSTRQLMIEGQPVTIANREAPTQFAILDTLETAGWPEEGVLAPKGGSIKDAVEALNITLSSTRLRILKLNGNQRIGWKYEPL